jgi:hypothetical protein
VSLFDNVPPKGIRMDRFPWGAAAGICLAGAIVIAVVLIVSA